MSDSYSSYLFTTQFNHYTIFWHEPTIFGFPEGLGNSSFSTTPVVDTVGAYSLPKIIGDPGNPHSTTCTFISSFT
jgi:hypothetical protein